MRSYLEFAIRSLLHRRMRAGLTILGIIIGVAAIVALISVSDGLETAIVDQFEMIGTNRLYIYPESTNMIVSFMGIEGLTDEDVKTVESVQYVDWVSAYVTGSAQVEYRNVEMALSINGVTNEDVAQRWADMDIGLDSGRFFVDDEENVVMLGNSVANKYFDREITHNNHILIGGQDFKVVGVLSKIGNEGDDGSIFMPLGPARDILDLEDDVHFIEVVLQDGAVIEEVVPKLERKLERARGDDNFEITTPEQLLAQFGVILAVMQVVLGGIAAISLIVGGVGIMNAMFTNVLERMQEIGVMKSIGATNFDILFFFLTESSLVGLIGGILGSALGTGIALSIGAVASYYDVSLLKIQPDFWLIMFGVLFALVLGAGSGFVPAWQASKLKPVEALRK